MYLKTFYRVHPLLVETCGRLFIPPYYSLYSSNTLSMEGKEASSSSKKNKIRMATLLSKKLVILTLYACLFIGKIVPKGVLPGPITKWSPSRTRRPQSASQGNPRPAP